MNLNSKLMELAKKASSAEEIVKLGVENGYSVTPEEAEKVLSLLNGNGQMSDGELEAIAGGKGGGEKTPDPKYHAGQVIWVGYPSTKNFLEVKVLEAEFYSKDYGSWRYRVMNEYGIEECYYLDTHAYLQLSNPHGVWPY